MNSLLLKFAKLNVVRNIAVAFVIAIGSTAITWVVNWKAQQNQTPPTTPIATVAPIVAIPDVANETPSQTVTETSDSIYIPELIPPPASYEQLISGYLASNPSQVVNYFEGDRQVDLFAIPIDTGADYKHTIQLYGSRRNHHYQFPYRCGCMAMTTPDQYRDVIYADPLRVAATYADRLCRDCTKLQAVLDEKKADSSDSQQTE